MDSSMTGWETAFERLDSFVEQKMLVDGTPGIAVALTDRGDILRIATYGLADVAARAPVTPETLFEIGSVSKSFTAIALLQLYEAGKLNLHAPVTDYLPWFRVRSRYEPITLHHLLSHTAGIVRGIDFSTDAHYEVWALRETEATTPPGTVFRYSNVGYKTLGLVLEKLTGLPYGEIIQQRILDPVGMAATVPVITHEARRRIAVGYEPLYDDRPYHRRLPLAPATWLETGTADGSIAATAADMASYVQMLLNRGRAANGRVLSQESLGLLCQPIVRSSGADWGGSDSYGYGLNITEERGHTVIGHSGGMVGYYSAVLADLDDGLGAVVLSNGPGEASKIAAYALKLLRALHHREELPALPMTVQPTHIENAADYAGQYASNRGAFTLSAQDGGLVMYYGTERLPLESRGQDSFYVPYADFERFLLRFGREQGRVVEAVHGPDWYVRGVGRAQGALDYPATWDAYPGHYRCHNPWHSNFRVVLRKGSLALAEPWGEEQALAPAEDSVFRVGGDEYSPERIRFDTIIDGQATRATLSGCDYYRTFTP